ncbi:hypothetical protein ES703_73535 [subsurface metagenome]
MSYIRIGKALKDFFVSTSSLSWEALALSGEALEFSGKALALLGTQNKKKKNVINNNGSNPFIIFPLLCSLT